MRILPAASCWKYAGGRIINLHHGLLPSFPGMKPYHDAYAAGCSPTAARATSSCRSSTRGNQIIYQSTFLVPPGMPLEEIIRRGQSDNEPHCLVEGVRRVGRRRSAAALQSGGGEVDRDDQRRNRRDRRDVGLRATVSPVDRSADSPSVVPSVLGVPSPPPPFFVATTARADCAASSDRRATTTRRDTNS